MGFQLSLDNNRYSVTLPADQYSNCHEFTLASIKALFQKYGGNVSVQINPFQGRLMAASAIPTAGIASIYKDMVVNGNAVLFTQAGCAALPAASLVLFMDLGGSLQHSMLVKKTDTWIGANNVGSLGAINTDVTLYPGMSTRAYTHAAMGGWLPGGGMASLFSGGVQDYNMYSIPIVV